MDVEVFIHGVPYGESFYGKDEDRNYFGKFYDQSCSDSVRFFIQTRMSNGKKYCYYNYLMYNNIIGNDGRSGSYFGMSVRFDAYCKNFINLYKILDATFCACVQNKILNVQKGNYKYAIQSFASSPDLMKNICNTILQLIQSSFTDSNFCSLNAFNGSSSSNLPAGNLYEANPNDVESAIKQYGQIAISPYYTTRRESLLTQQTESKIQQIRQQYDERLNANTAAQNQELTTARNELSSIKEDRKKLENIVSRKDEEISRNNEYISKLETKIKHIERNQKAARNIESIKAPVLELAEALGGRTQQPNGNNHQKKPITFRGMLPLLQFVIIILMLIILLLKFPLVNDNNKNEEQRTSCTETTHGENSYQGNTEGTTNTFNTDDGDPNVDGDKGQETSSTHIIDVALYNENNGVYLTKDKVYTASINDNTSDDGIIWTIEGGEIDGDNNKRAIKFVPQSSKIVISFKNSEGESDTRILKVQN